MISEKDDFSNAFVKMVGELATAIHVNVCVEGVETKEQLDALVGSKVQLIQGFYFGKPMKAEMFGKTVPVMVLSFNVK